MPDNGRVVMPGLAAVVFVLNDNDELLMMRRHRWIIDRWVWEIPGGYMDDHEGSAAASGAREVEEETGWRPRTMDFLCSFQPMVGAADAENLLFFARGADDTGAGARHQQGAANQVDPAG